MANLNENFKEINILEIPLKVFQILHKDWMLVTAGDVNKNNTMTASWGAFGVIWHKPTATIYIRPQRYTKKFLDNNSFFTLSFFGEKYKDILSFCGSHSGADVNKIEKTGLSVISVDNSVSFAQAGLILLCEKQYCQQITPSNILDKKITKNFYKDEDFHFVYMGQITKAYLNKTNLLF